MDRLGHEMVRAGKERRRSLELLERSAALTKRAAALSGSAWALMRHPLGYTDLALKDDIDQFRQELLAVDREMLDSESIYSGLNRDLTAAELNIWLVVRTTIGRYVDEASSAVSDASMRSITGGTLFISVLVLIVAMMTMMIH